MSAMGLLAPFCLAFLLSSWSTSSTVQTFRLRKRLTMPPAFLTSSSKCSRNQERDLPRQVCEVNSRVDTQYLAPLVL